MIKLQINQDGMFAKWDDGYEMCLHLLWGISALGGSEVVSLNRKYANGYEFIIQWMVDTIDPQGERATYQESGRLKIEDYHSRDSYLPQVSESLHKVFLRAGKADRVFVGWLLKQWEPFFAALDGRFEDMKFNISVITQVFEQPIRIPSAIFQGIKKDLAWSPKDKDNGKDKE
jgi:hypothetical protein